MDDLQSETQTKVDGIKVDVAADADWLRDLIQRCTLGEMRERFAKSMLLNEDDGADQANEAHPGKPSDDVELF